MVEFLNVPHFSNNDPITTQVHLFEGTGRIEIHITNMPSDGGNHTQGIENIDGTQAYGLPDRNQANWSASNECVAFISGLPVTCVPPSGSVFPAGTTVVTCSASDQVGNTSTCTFEVTVGLNVQFQISNILIWGRPSF